MRALAQRMVDRIPAENATTEAAADAAAAKMELQTRIDQLHALIFDLERRNLEYFDVIASIEKQRDEWKRMYFDSSQKNMAAHEMLKRHARSLGVQLTKAVAVLNGFLRLVDRKPVALEDDLMALADDVAADYQKHIEQLTSAAPDDIEGLLMRAAIRDTAIAVLNSSGEVVSPPEGE